MVKSVRLSVRLSLRHTFFTMFPSSYHHEIFRSYYHGQKRCPCKRSRSEVKGQGHRDQNPTFPDCYSSLNSHRAMHTAWSTIEEVSYCSMWSFEFPGHTGQIIANLDPNLAFPDCNCSLNWPMAMKWCTKLDEVPYCFPRSYVIFQGHRGQKIADFYPNLPFPDCNLSCISLMAIKWCTRLEAT